MDPEETFESAPLNPNNFPAKLWRLVNSPHYQSIYWDSTGDGVIIDKKLFELELLCPSRGINLTPELFKTTNFTSFIRQLNLYGFRKLVVGTDSSAGLHSLGLDTGAVDGSIHHFFNDHFQKGRPDLLVNMKRLTSINKAKLAAGLEVNTRPPNRFQKLLTGSMTEDSKGDWQGMMTVDHIHRSCRREHISPYPYVNPPSHNQIAIPGKKFDCSSISPRTWSNSFGLHHGQFASHSSFAENRLFYPVLQHFPTDINYTMQSTATSVHLQQGNSTMPGPVPRYTSYMPHAQYAQAYYPSAFLPYCPTPAHLHHLNGCSGSAGPSYQHCSYFQFADELQSSSQLEVDTTEILVDPATSPLQNAAESMSPGNHQAYYIQASQLASLLPVNADFTSEVLLVDQPVNCQSPLTSSDVYPLNSDDTEVDMNTSSDVDINLCVDEVDLLTSDIAFSPSQKAKCEHRDDAKEISQLESSADLNLLVEVACERQQFAKKN
ncbi:heat shock factor protein 5 isoform X2 [Anomaloglossus baeobatrachus]|uniref:heat shock factor protein 5 isoform X2 n=1 Tax=Anomaloglossus baeobatrachus TaxID=238106 RepID=UPI003F5089C9